VASRRSKREILRLPLVAQGDNPCPIVICDSAPRSFRKVGGYQNGRRGTSAAAFAALSLVSRPTARFSAYLHNSNITVAEGYEETQQIFYVRICTAQSAATRIQVVTLGTVFHFLRLSGTTRLQRLTELTISARNRRELHLRSKNLPSRGSSDWNPYLLHHDQE
jgi:hypothetical protein